MMHFNNLKSQSLKYVKNTGFQRILDPILKALSKDGNKKVIN